MKFLIGGVLPYYTDHQVSLCGSPIWAMGTAWFSGSCYLLFPFSSIHYCKVYFSLIFLFPASLLFFLIIFNPLFSFWVYLYSFGVIKLGLIPDSYFHCYSNVYPHIYHWSEYPNLTKLTLSHLYYQFSYLSTSICLLTIFCLYKCECSEE